MSGYRSLPTRELSIDSCADVIGLANRNAASRLRQSGRLSACHAEVHFPSHYSGFNWRTILIWGGSRHGWGLFVEKTGFQQRLLLWYVIYIVRSYP